MITFSQLGNMGRLGNQLFQICSVKGIADRNNQKYGFPVWNLSSYFKNKIPVSGRLKNSSFAEEPHYHYSGDFFDQKIRDGENLDIKGWLQTEKYWNSDQKSIQEFLEFDPVFKERLIGKYSDVFSKETIAISIRRGDFVGNPNYEQLPIEYYIGALIKNFPDYKNYNIFFFSDDLTYCKHHFEFMNNVFFPRNEGPIQQLCLMSNCTHFIISNSTFSWWGAYLGQKENSIIVRPNYNMSGNLLKNNSEIDYWPSKWTNIYDHKKEKIDLSDVTFTIPVKYDHEDRAQNLRLCVEFLEKFNTNIIIGEQGGPHFTETFKHKHIHFPYNKFHRTKMLNEMALISETDIIANWDADVICNPMQLVETVRMLRDQWDMVYPYDGRFGRVNRKKWYTKLRDSKDTEIFKSEIFSGTKPHDALSVGGAVLFKKNSFIQGGMENENFISYAPEDQERYYRFNKLGYKVARVKGVIYHIDHHVGNDSWTQHDLYKDNEKEFFRIRGIDNLRKEVDSWPWVKPYTHKYYEEIIGGSTKSRDEVFRLPELQNIKSIIDIGAGVGQWGKDLSVPYTAVDFQIPGDMLLVENYIDWDITSNIPFPLTDRYDLALCLEVMEHISEQYAEKTIKLLTQLSDKILFSAAIPGQGGICHVNEQWQTYWANLFSKFGYYPKILDIRDNPNIEIWYRNNMFLYVNYDTGIRIPDYVHPDLYTNIVGTLTNWTSISPRTLPL